MVSKYIENGTTKEGVGESYPRHNKAPIAGDLFILPLASFCRFS